jgi:hypothetical protein
MSLDSGTLIASLIWGSIGGGFFVYGMKQKEWVPAFGGVALTLVSYFIGSALYMSLASVALIAGIFWLKNRF